MKKNLSDRIYTTTTISSEELERSDDVVQHIRSAWENLPEDIDISEREMFIEIASKVIKLHSSLVEEKKQKDHLN